MSPQIPVNPRAVAEKAREVIARVRPGTTEGHRALPVRADPEAITRLWSEPGTQPAVLDGLGAASARIERGPDAGDWGRVVTLDLTLEAPQPGLGAQALAGKAVRRLKSLAETGEVPTTERQPSARADAGEAA